MIKKIIITLSIIFIFTIIGLTIFYQSVKDEVVDILHHKMEKSTIVLDKNGDKLANIIGKEFRLYVKFEDIPPQVIEALLAIEDTTFFEHNGINLEAIFRAIIKDIIAMGMVEGASTITQQFVRNTVLTKKKTIYRKLKEVFLSIEIERIMSKEKILEQYLNKIYFGSGFYGIKTASWGYFKKELDELSLKEIAILIGLIKAPSFYDPTKNYDYSIGRANRVITRMYEGLGWINEKEFEKSIAENPKAKRGTKTENKAPYITDYILKKLIKDIPDLRTGGYVIETTIDLDIQNIARESLQTGYKNILKQMNNKKYSKERIKQLNGSIISLNQKNGNVLAMVGGVSYKESSFNRVIQAKRQIGSSIKPFFYQVGLNLGYSGASILNDVQKTYDYVDGNGNKKKWKPQNYSKKVTGRIKLRDALIRSRNLATIDLVDKLGANNFYNSLKRYGFKNMSRDLSTALGSYTTTMFNLAQQYTLISNYGEITTLRIIKKVSKDGSEIFKSEIKSKRINSKKQAYLIIDIMKDVVKKGSGRKARIQGLELAGKTGTTDKGKDVWFNIFSPEIQTHIWYGNDDSTPIFDKRVSSSQLAAPVGKIFFQSLIKIKHIENKFYRPKGVHRYKFNDSWENFTDISKPPITKNREDDESLIF